jgi:hypothetical protein
MKNISTMLNRGNLTPRERFLLLIQNDVHKIKTGKEILSEADKVALENWGAEKNSEAAEWNTLNEAWKYSGRIEIEAEFIYKDAQVSHLGQLPIIMKLLSYPSDRDMGKCIKTLDSLKKVTIGEAAEIAAKQKAIKLQDGLDFDYAVYKLAFERLTAKDRERMEELYQDVSTDQQYLDQEEVIANLFNGKKELSVEAKEKLSALVAEQSYNKFSKEYQFFHYFACIPVLEIARHFLKCKGIETKGEPFAKNQEAHEEDEDTVEQVTKKMEAYATEHKISIEAMLKEACLKALNDDLFERYTPLVISDDADLFNRWLNTKTEAKARLRQHINAGELTIEKRADGETRRGKLNSKELYDHELEAARTFFENLHLEVITKGELDEKTAFETFNDAIITGESLYNLKEPYEFLKDFKERVDTYEPNLGIVYADDDPDHTDNHLDREFVICGLNKDGKPHIFSLYGMSMARLSGSFDGKMIFEEKTKDGKIFLNFNKPEIENAFTHRQKNLIEGYTKLLAFEEIFKKLSKVYETDLAYHIADRIKILKEYMEQTNQAIQIATNTDEASKIKFNIFRRRDTLQFKKDLMVDIKALQPDRKAVEEHEQKLKSILSEF